MRATRTGHSGAGRRRGFPGPGNLPDSLPDSFPDSRTRNLVGALPRNLVGALPRNLVVGICSLALLGISALPADSAVVRLGDDVVPVEQTVELDLDPSLATYSGRTEVRLEVRRKTGSFRFHAESLEITSIGLTQGGSPLSAVWEMLDGAMVEVTAEFPLDPGPLDFEVEFRDDYNTNAVSLYRMETHGRSYLFTQFEADDAREAFPCWDEPGFKIPFQLILTVPAGDVAISNTPIESEALVESRVVSGAERTPNRMKRVVFAKTKPLPTYLLALAVGAFDSYEMEGLGVPGRIYTVTGQSHLARLAAEEAPRILHALEAYFGRPYPYAKLDFLAVPDFWPGAMEHPGAITYAEGLLLKDPRFTSARARRGMVGTIAHELAHQWFGNLVTMEWWNDLWLNESFADWLADRIVSDLYPELNQDAHSARSEQNVMLQDARPSVYPIRRPVEDTGSLLQGIGIAYNKGKAVLGMFEDWIGEDQFRLGVLDYIEASAWGNATSDDLWTALAGRSSERLPRAMTTFVEQPGFPLIEIEPLGDGRLRLTQMRFHNAGAEVEPQTWTLPVRLGTPDPVATFLLEDESRILESGSGKPPEWIRPKVGARGYYRWSLPDSMMARLLEHRGELSTRERIDLIENAGALLHAGRMRGPAYLETLRAFAVDPDPVVLSALTDKLEFVRDQLVSDTASHPFAQYVTSVCRPIAARLGWEPVPGEDSSVEALRPHVLLWLGRDGRDPSARAWADRSTQSYLADPGSLHPSLVPTALEITAFDGDRAFFATLRDRFGTANDPAQRRLYLSALGAFGSEELQRDALDFAMTDAVRASEVRTLVRGVADDDRGRDLFFAWLEENYVDYISKIPPIYHPLIPYSFGGCSPELLERAETFLARPENAKPGMAVSFAQMRDQTQDCDRLRQREGRVVAEYLRTNSRATTGGGSPHGAAGGGGSR